MQKKKKNTFKFDLLSHEEIEKNKENKIYK